MELNKKYDLGNTHRWLPGKVDFDVVKAWGRGQLCNLTTFQLIGPNFPIFQF